MSRLRFPIKTVLRSPADEAALHRVWQNVDARLSAPGRSRIQRRAMASMLALAAAGAAVFLVWAGRRQAGPLRLASGASVAVVETAAVESRMALSDGSEILLSPGSRLEPLETSGSVFNAVLARGRATFDVRPGGPRRWIIECGLATVEVVGTRFACAREPDRLRVTVERGAVLVRGELIRDRARRLVMGESIDITAAAAPSAVVPASPSLAPPPPASPSDAVVVPAKAPGQARLPHERAGSAGEQPSVRAGAEAASGGTEPGDVAPRSTTSAGDLLAVADRARISGHPADAVAPLERILAEMAGDPQAPLAAFALGRLELDSLNRPRRAVAALERALALGLPRSLEEEARARLVEAYDRTGDAFAATDAARDLLKAFPHGRHARAMRARLATP